MTARGPSGATVQTPRLFKSDQAMKDKLFIALQYLVPQALLSRAAGLLANTRARWIKDPFTRWFVNRFDVDMSEAVIKEPERFATFNDFFTRELVSGARPIDAEPDSVVFPADGCISQIGAIKGGRIFQAKGFDFSLTELLGGDSELASPFHNGSFATVYLSPKDYHRVHIPRAGKLTAMVHIPGDLFSVNDTTAQNVPRLFSRNERVACLFETDAGPMAVILVGAMIVASIETVWAGQIAPVPRQVQTTVYGNQEAPTFEKGDEIGRFKLGSTAIVLFGEGAVNWLADYQAGSPTRMGEKMGERVL